MQIINDITEDEMVAVFLKTEINSGRFKKYILDILKRDGRDREIIDNPNISNQLDNKYRTTVLGETRGYGQNKWLFSGFPINIKWQRVRLNKKDLEKIKFINLDAWKESTNSRSPKDRAKSIKLGKEPGLDNNLFLGAARAMDRGVQFPEMILVAKNKISDPVVLEGHLRITAYWLCKNLPDSLEVILGVSPELDKWAFY